MDGVGQTVSVAAGDVVRALRQKARFEFARQVVRTADPSWTDDLKLFGMAWAVGFVFFLIFIA